MFFYFVCFDILNYKIVVIQLLVYAARTVSSKPLMKWNKYKNKIWYNNNVLQEAIINIIRRRRTLMHEIKALDSATNPSQKFNLKNDAWKKPIFSDLELFR